MIRKALFIASVVAIFGCNPTNGSKEVNLSPLKDVEMLNGTWQVLKLADQTIGEVERMLTLGFNVDEQRIFGCTSCNQIMGNFHVDISDGGKITLGEVASTMMACQDSDVEQAYLTSLSNSKYIAADTTQTPTLLYLLNESKDPEMVLIRSTEE